MVMRVALAVLGLLLVSCSPAVTTNVAALGPAPEEPSGELFRVYFNDSRVERSYVEIGLVTAETYSEDDAALIEALRARALALNADAIVVTNRSTANEGAYFVGSVAVASVKTTMQAVAIVYTD